MDPSIAIAALGLKPEYFERDLVLFGHHIEKETISLLRKYNNDHECYIAAI